VYQIFIFIYFFIVCFFLINVIAGRAARWLRTQEVPLSILRFESLQENIRIMFILVLLRFVTYFCGQLSSLLFLVFLLIFCHTKNLFFLVGG
jgi:hypothetical protein